MEIREKITELRNLMKEDGIDAYIITTSDYHGSEYVSDYFKEREYMSGFTGSAGTLVVLQNKAALWTDGRYFIQAAKQLENTGITLMKMGTEGTPDIKKFLFDELESGQCIGFDGRTFSALFAVDLCKNAAAKRINVKSNVDLPDRIWTDRPKMPDEQVWELETEYTGMECGKKLEYVREMMKESGADVLVLSSLDDIAWLLNMRGNDVKYNPVFLGYMIIFENKAYLYVNKANFSDKQKIALAKVNVEMRKYKEFYDNLSALTADNIMLDKTKVNYEIIKCIGNDKKIINETNPTTVLKAIKTATEMKNMQNAHIKDGVAVTKFMYWLKKNVGKEEMTELSCTEKLENFRKEQEGYLGPSFEPIVAYGENAALCHYAATQESDAKVAAENFLLADTGGQYYEGTTDITRTFALGELTDEQKKMYTLVMIGNLKLAAVKFPYGVRGVNLDVLAREALWRNGLDFNHGTGHGVGYLLNVHEGPNNIRYRIVADNVSSAVFEEGMITSNEPGLYFEGEYGIRLENLILCRKAEKNEYGQFMCFETLTMVPFDLDAVDVKYMNADEIKMLNDYHKKVYDSISPYLNENEVAWLKEATKEIDAKNVDIC